jgi:hypothetical protein
MHVDPLAGHYVIELLGELRVPILQQVRGRHAEFFNLNEEIPGGTRARASC